MNFTSLRSSGNRDRLRLSQARPRDLPCQAMFSLPCLRHQFPARPASPPHPPRRHSGCRRAAKIVGGSDIYPSKISKTIGPAIWFDGGLSFDRQGLEADQATARYGFRPKPRADRAVSHSYKAIHIASAIDAAGITSPERRLLGLWPPDP